MKPMGPLKKDLTPLSKGGTIDKHKGKGSTTANMPDRNQIKGLPGGSMNDYAKATPMPRPELMGPEGLY